MITRCPSCFQEYDTEYGICPYCGFSVEGSQTENYCLLMGTEIADRYIIGGMLGLGGFGITYRAWDKKLETVVAIKEYFPSGMVNRMPGRTEVMLIASKRRGEVQCGKERFLDEARNLARFNTHPNIVNVFDYFEANNTAYIVMEYLDGSTLGKTVRDQGRPLPPEQCCDIARDICEALRALHASNILHRDISPDNIFLCKNGSVKLIDFGAARFAENQDARLTIVVKPGFAPPEQYERVNRQGPWTDLYALGATLYYMLTGQRPVESTNRKIQDDLKEPATINEDVPGYLNTAVMRAMALDISDRYHTVDEFEQILTQQKKPVSLASARRHRKRTRIVSAGISVLAVVAIFVITGLIWASRQTPTADLRLWYSLSESPESDQGKAQALQKIAEQFQSDYPTVTISLRGIAASEYQEALNEANMDDRPDIYESDGFVLPEPVDLQPVLEQLRGRGGLADAELQGGQYPAGIDVPVIYVNTALAADKAVDFSTLTALRAAYEPAGGTLVVSQDFSELYERLYGSETEAYAGSDASKFLRGEAMIYLGSSEDYQAIQDGLPGLYSVHFPETGYTAYRYDSLWSVSSGDAETRRAALLFLEYLTSDLAQDYLHIRRQSGGVPITPEMLEQFESIYPEMSELSGFLALPFVE